MNTPRPSWSRIGGVLVSVALATSPILPSVAWAEAAESVDKAETVQVQTTPTGEVTSITVQDTLSNGDKADVLDDRSTLSDIDAGEDGPAYTTGTDGALSWDAKGEQVNYEGTSTAEPPVGVEVSYTLDGAAQQPEQLAGASGHLVMRIDYHNNSSQMRNVGGEQKLIYTPFVCMTVAMLDSEVFSNVQVENGKVIEDKGGLAVIGYALPGLEESLELDDDVDVDIPTYVQIEADVTDLAMDPLYTMVTPELFTDIDAKDLDFGDMGEGADELQDAMAQLVQGSGTLTDALRQISSGTQEMNGGIQEFRKKLGLLPDGLSALATGASTLADGIGTARDVAGQLAQGTGALPQLAQAASGGVQQAQDAVGAAKEKVNSASGATAAVKEAAKTVKLDDVKKAADETKGAAAEVSTQAKSAAEALGATEAQVSGKDEASASITAASDALAAFDQINTTGMKEEQIAALQAARQSVQDKLGEAQASVEAITATVTAPDLSTLQSAVTTLDEKAQALDSATVDLSTVVDKSESAQTAIGEASTALEGASQTLAAVQGDEGPLAALNQGAGGIHAGAQGLATALDGAADGSRKLATTLSDTAAMGPQIVAGTDALSKGMEQLGSALDATADGSSQLTDGLQTFNDEGIAKVVEAFEDMDGSLEGAKDRIDALRAAAREYNNFAGKADGQSGSVRFIFKSEQIG